MGDNVSGWPKRTKFAIHVLFGSSFLNELWCWDDCLCHVSMAISAEADPARDMALTAHFDTIMHWPDCLRKIIYLTGTHWRGAIIIALVLVLFFQNYSVFVFFSQTETASLLLVPLHLNNERASIITGSHWLCWADSTDLDSIYSR